MTTTPMTFADIQAFMPEAIRLLKATVELLNDPDADWTDAYKLQGEIHAALQIVEGKK